MKRIAVIPAYEPDEGMVSLLMEAEEAGLVPVVVDDGSGSAYEELFRVAARHAHVIFHPENRGKGRAMKTAFSWIMENQRDPSTVVVMDCDGQHTVSDALRLCAAAERAPEALLLGSRKQSKASPLRSRFGNSVTRFVYRLSTGCSVYDTQTGLRAFHSNLLPSLLEIPGERYEYEMNMLLQCSRDGIPIQELPIETIYFHNNSGSHFHTLRDSWRIYREIIQFSASSLLGFVIDYLLYSLFLTLGSAAVTANVAARFISASVNFTVNRKLVFRTQEPLLQSAAKYLLLAAGILAENSAILSALLSYTALNPYGAKLLTEMTLFLSSWLVQRRFIFKKQKKGENPKRRHSNETALEQ